MIARARQRRRSDRQVIVGSSAVRKSEARGLAIAFEAVKWSNSVSRNVEEHERFRAHAIQRVRNISPGSLSYCMNNIPDCAIGDNLRETIVRMASTVRHFASGARNLDLLRVRYRYNWTITLFFVNAVYL